MRIHTTTVPDHFQDIDKLDQKTVAPHKKSHRVLFKSVDKNPGIYAVLPAAQEGFINSFALMPDGVAPVGDLFVSTVDPTVDYDAFFLYTVLEDIPITTKGPKMWRKTEIHGAAYSTIQVNPGQLYLLVLGGPSAEFKADVAMTLQTD